MTRLFTPLTLRDVEVRNRLWVSPMCQYSAVDGVPQEWHHTHLAQFASGGAGLIIAEATAVVPEGRISPRDTGLWTDAQRDAWAPIVAAVRSRGAVAGVQLAHAGRKASTWWPFAEHRGSVPADQGGWTTTAPSAIAFEGFAEPVALDLAGIDRVVDAFAAAARRAVEAASRCSSCTPRTGTCCTSSSRRCRTTATTPTAARSRTGHACCCACWTR